MTTAPRAYSVVLDWLEEQLRSGEIVVGDKLPGERALAEQFGISRASVREATRILDAMGLVRSGVGSGPNAGAIVISEPSAALAWALRMHVATKALPVRDLVQTRLVLETQAARDGAAAPDSEERAQILRSGDHQLHQRNRRRQPGLAGDLAAPAGPAPGDPGGRREAGGRTGCRAAARAHHLVLAAGQLELGT